MDFIKLSKFSFALSFLFIAASLVAIGFQGFNLGIDFTGGTSLIVNFAERPNLDQLRTVLSAERVQITTLENDFVIKTAAFSEQHKDELLQILDDNFGETRLLDYEAIGPSAGSELQNQAYLLTVLVLAGILIYITFRFELWTGLAAVAGLLHDVIITLGFVSWLGLDFNISMIAAILTIIGYSINATIIIFDRVRENLGSKEYAGADLALIANQALLSVLGRCINTSVTTILAVLAVYLFGGLSIKAFALTMLIGFTVGAYSSIFIAAPLYVFLRRRRF
ncbi:preprotein translocase subunit SecF [Candidatus Termititenax persephonae]|uniref:Protein-export membrane protein SecF n=1 Tax=Candidatus Termititenax persephonae TaxID=2218525 RepID=A0A388TFW7_9BACT|nr:preprotein translocase subunit SecF [Candidatus Termititenax persephonae]